MRFPPLSSSLLGCLLWLTIPPAGPLAQSSGAVLPSDAQLSPQAAYEEALHPLEVTRHNIANWSDTELAAMNVAIARAGTDCGARKPESYTGTDLVDLARLCSLGQQWPAVLAAASRYIGAPGEPKPQLTDAFVAQTEASLRLKQEPAALQSALAMLKAVPYSADVGDCVDEALGYMRFVHTQDAVALAEARQPYVLAALRTTATAPTPVLPASAAAPAGASLSALYAQGQQLPMLQLLSGRHPEAEQSLLALETALPKSPSQDDTLRIARLRRRYALLGKPLTGITPLRSLSMPTNVLPALPAHGAITAMLLFPDWCAQCVRLGPQLPPTVFTVEGHSAYVYGLLSETVPERKPDPTVTNAAFSPAYAASMLAETPVVTIPPSTLIRFEADDFPLLLLTDSNGILRVLQPVSVQDLQPGGDLDAAIALVGRFFSGPKSASSPPSAALPAPKEP